RRLVPPIPHHQRGTQQPAGNGQQLQAARSARRAARTARGSTNLDDQVHGAVRGVPAPGHRPRSQTPGSPHQAPWPRPPPSDLAHGHRDGAPPGGGRIPRTPTKTAQTEEDRPVSDPVAPIARAAATRLATDHGRALTTDVEAALARRGPAQPPE